MLQTNACKKRNLHMYPKSVHQVKGKSKTNHHANISALLPCNMCRYPYTCTHKYTAACTYMHTSTNASIKEVMSCLQQEARYDERRLYLSRHSIKPLISEHMIKGGVCLNKNCHKLPDLMPAQWKSEAAVG